jgi:SAM-dependent methyltransferase
MAFMTDRYRQDLAFVHDRGFGSTALGAADLLVRELRDRSITAGVVLDLGCGSGILAEAVVAAGYGVVGIDVSEAMIALARGRVPAGDFRVGSVLGALLPPGCVAVAAVGEVVNYLFDHDHSLERVRELPRRIFDALVPGGVLLLDAAGPGRVPGGVAPRRAVEGDGWAVLFGSEESADGILTRRITTFRQVGELYRRDEEIHRQRLIDPALLEQWLRGAGFGVRMLEGYGEERFRSGVTGLLAVKDTI